MKLEILFSVFALASAYGAADNQATFRSPPNLREDLGLSATSTGITPWNSLMAGDPAGRSVIPYPEVSILATNRALLTLVQPKLGVPLTVKWELRDEQNVLLYQSTDSYTPNRSPWSVYRDFAPDFNKHKAGRWTWWVQIVGGEKFTTSIVVLPYTPSEKAMLAQHQKAGEQIRKAMGSYWLAHPSNLNLFVKIIETPPRTVASVDEVTYFVNEATGARQTTSWNPKKNVFFGQGPVPKYVREHKELTFLTNWNAPTNRHYYLQVAHWSPSFSQRDITQADERNGITYSAVARLSLWLYRVYDGSQGGWLEWRQASPPPLVSLITFRTIEKDGNWFVDTSEGDRFANGKRVVEGSPQKTRSQSFVRVMAPMKEEMDDLLDTGAVPVRDTDKRLGDAAKRNPEAIERDLIETMRVLRGRILM